MAKRKTKEDYYELAEGRGFKWLGEVLPKNVNTRTLWECGEKHRWEARYHSIYDGRGCPYCSGHIKKTEEDYYVLAESRGFEWLGEVLPKNVNTRTLWGCGEKHRWKATYDNIHMKKGCPYCAGNAKLKIGDYYKLAKRRGFKWLDIELPKDNKTKTLWECKEGHTWCAEYNSINGGSGCPYCSGKAKKIRKDYYDLAKKHSLNWIDTVLPKNVNTKTRWKCKKCGYILEVSYNCIQQSKHSSCKVCAGNMKKTEEDYHFLAEFYDFEWAGDKLPKNIKTKTKWRCKKAGHFFKTRYNDIQQESSGCPYCSGMIKKTFEHYGDVGKSRGITWVGGILPKNTGDLTWWECEKGHRWRATYSSIQQGSGCPICKNIINGVMASKPQIKLNSLLYGSLNYQEGKRRIDVAIIRKSQKIAVEYDCQYWHKGKEKQEDRRDKFLILFGWKMLHVKSRRLLPTRKQLKAAINYLLETNNKIYNLYLKDWK